ncbi:MAG: efflux RND transporter periplasmic adaptor subunit [Candidatus Moranbacteria bacterium]|nr:efflux RND transporter periplasmic adaptor subunit [Candidatus Moranbacteria bacterium]
MLQKKYLLIFALAAIPFGAFLATGDSSDKLAVSVGTPGKKVAATPITLAEFSPQSPYCGFAVGAQRAEIAPEINGTVQTLLKNEGDAVRAGEIVATIDDRTIDAQASGSARVSGDLQKTYRDTKKLYDQKVDEAKAALKKSKASYDDGDATKEDVKLAEEAVDSAKRARDLQIASARVQVSSAESQQSVAESYAQKKTIRAPFSGTITRRNATVGSFVAAGTSIYSLSAPGTVEIELSVPKSIIEKLHDNQTIRLAEEDSSSVDGFVYAKNPFLNFGNPNGIVRLRMKDPAETSVSIGDYVCADFPLSEPKEALSVPENSILHEFGDSFVFVAQDGIARKKNVTTGATAEGQTEILSGLQPGEIVITQGLNEIDDDDLIIY